MWTAIMMQQGVTQMDISKYINEDKKIKIESLYRHYDKKTIDAMLAVVNIIPNNLKNSELFNDMIDAVYDDGYDEGYNAGLDAGNKE